MQLGRRADALAAADAGIAACREGVGLPLWVGVLQAIRVAIRATDRDGCEQAGADLAEAERLAGTAIWVPALLGVIAKIHVNVLRHDCPALYDGPLSLERARLATAHHDNEDNRATLGALLYAEGLWGEALEVLEQLDDQIEFDRAENLFYLAMTYGRLGRKSDARRCYDRAVARMTATFPHDPTSRRRQREAATLLGVAARRPTGGGS